MTLDELIESLTNLRKILPTMANRRVMIAPYAKYSFSSLEVTSMCGVQDGESGEVMTLLTNDPPGSVLAAAEAEAAEEGTEIIYLNGPTN
jgi:hypothetical protein